MKKDLLTGAAVALFALIVPLGLVLIEGQPKPLTTAKKPASKADKPIAATVELTPRLALANQVADAAAPAVASTEALSSEIEFFGGGPAIEFVEATQAVTSPALEVSEPTADHRSLDEIIAAVDLAAVTPEPMPPESGLSEEDEKFAAAFDKLVAENAQEKPVVKVVVVERDKAEKDKKTKPEDSLKRVIVTYVRPTDKTVRSTETIIGKTSARGTPVFLVRPREAGSNWWVQETAVKQGIYFRGAARFGNANSLDGAPFTFVIAFVPKAEDVPELGSQVKVLPTEWSYSPEVIYTLKRN